jgi:hypothetical protein
MMNSSLAAMPLAVVAASLALFFAGPEPADAQDNLGITSSITYDVQTGDVPVRATWDLTITDNDPATQPDGSGTLSYYHTVNLPVIRGATNARATDGAGNSLRVYVNDVGAGVAESAAVELAEPLFYGDTYSFRLTYTLPSARSEGILVTPNYAYLPLITAGDEATVVVNTPAGDPWQTTLEGRECAANGNSFTVAAAMAHTWRRPLRCSSRGDRPHDVRRRAGEDGAPGGARVPSGRGRGGSAPAGSCRAALPLIEENYGVAYDGPVNRRLAHGGRQSVLGYEGLASCSDAGCDIVISPVADDYTVLHEMAHLWSDLYTKRWLAEGFAELVAHDVVDLLPTGTFVGTIPERRAAGTNIQLDDWGDPGSILGADADEVAVIEAGYDYSLRFLRYFESEYGLDMLRAVNRTIVATGPTDSRRYMDLVEAETGENLDADFLLWVFPDPYREILADRRQARDRLDALKATLAAKDLSPAPLSSIEQQVAAWQFKEALAGIEQMETHLDTYAELSSQLNTLERDVEAAGLVLSDEIVSSLNRFDFNAAEKLLASSRRALDLYLAAESSVKADRTFWENFGLLGSDPDGELERAAKAFEEGQFSESARHSEDAVDLISGVSSMAFKRMLIVAGLLSLMALFVGLAMTYGRLRHRRAAQSWRR